MEFTPDNFSHNPDRAECDKLKELQFELFLSRNRMICPEGDSPTAQIKGSSPRFAGVGQLATDREKDRHTWGIPSALLPLQAIQAHALVFQKRFRVY
jgi:hypothetical protein